LVVFDIFRAWGSERRFWRLFLMFWGCFSFVFSAVIFAFLGVFLLLFLSPSKSAETPMRKRKPKKKGKTAETPLNKEIERKNRNC
jgi:hypothetical protein